MHYIDEFLDVVVKTSEKGKAEVTDFLEGILTPSEFEHLVKRLQIVKQLKQGRSQRDIAEDLEVGIATVTRGAKEINNGKFKDI